MAWIAKWRGTLAMDGFTPVAAGMWLLMMSGIQLGMGTLGPAVREAGEGVYPAFLSSSGFKGLASGFGVIAAGIVMDYWRSKLRVLSRISALCNIGFVFVGLSIATNSTFFMFLGNLLVGLAAGAMYTFGLLTSLQWMQQSSAGVALCMLSYVGGTIASTNIVLALSKTVAVPTIFLLEGIFVCLGAYLSASCLEEPDFGRVSVDEEMIEAPVPKNSSVQVGLQVFLQKELYLLMAIVGITMGPSTGIANAFSGLLKDLVALDPASSACVFSVLTVVGFLSRLVGGFLSKSLRFQGFFSSGPKNLAMVSLLLELLSVFLLRIGVKSQPLFVIGLVLHWISMSLMQIDMVFLGEELFGYANSGIVFGVCNLSGGFAGLLCTQILASIDGVPPVDQQSMFGHITTACMILCVFILASSVPLSRCELCFSEPTKSPSTTCTQSMVPTEKMIPIRDVAEQVVFELDKIVQPFARASSSFVDCSPLFSPPASEEDSGTEASLLMTRLQDLSQNYESVNDGEYSEKESCRNNSPHYERQAAVELSVADRHVVQHIATELTSSLLPLYQERIVEEFAPQAHPSFMTPIFA